MTTMEKTIVIGGSGFIGQAIQEQVRKKGLDENFVFSYNKNAVFIDKRLQKARINLLEKTNLKIIERSPVAIYVAGSADHGLAQSSPSIDLDLNVKAFLHFAERFRGSLILLSSQAVYYGLEGEVPENVDHVSTMPYGLSKQMTEAYAMHFCRTGTLRNLWIFRLMYAFGKGEKSRRLIPRCADASRGHGKVEILGGGRSFLNPLPSWFVAQVLLGSAERMARTNDSLLEVTNLCYPENVRVGDIVGFLSKVKNFDYSVSEGGEERPVRFWGNPEKLSSCLRKLKLKVPDVWKELEKYFLELIEGVNGRV